MSDYPRSELVKMLVRGEMPVSPAATGKRANREPAERYGALHAGVGREGGLPGIETGKDRDANAPAKLGGERQTIDDGERYYRPIFRVITNPAADTMPTRQGTAKAPRAKAPARAVLSLVCMDGVRVDHASTRSGWSR